MATKDCKVIGPEFQRVSAADLKATINSVEYRWRGGFGCLMESQERGVKRGEVRIIAGVVFYADQASNCGWKRTVSWVPQAKFNVAWIGAFKTMIFGVYL